MDRFFFCTNPIQQRGGRGGEGSCYGLHGDSRRWRVNNLYYFILIFDFVLFFFTAERRPGGRRRTADVGRGGAGGQDAVRRHDDAQFEHDGRGTAQTVGRAQAAGFATRGRHRRRFVGFP